MPVPGFLASFADKAQNAIHASPLVSHSSNSSDPQNNKSHAIESIQYQIRAFGQQYSTTTPVQKIITAEKGVALDFDSVSRNAKSQSKELYTWGQAEAADLKDVTDRLAYLNFVQGSLASSLGHKLDAARAPFKALRNAETNLAPRRNLRAGLLTQLARLEHDQAKGMERKIAELKDQIRKAEIDDEPQEREIDLLKRKAVRESEQLKWEAVREYGEKLVLLSQAATPIIAVLPTLPPNESNPYAGGQATGAARASLQRALDNYKTGHINLQPQSAGSDLSRSDTLSFGESHASELSKIGTEAPLTQSPEHTPMPVPTHLPSTSGASPIPDKQSPSPPINPSVLNQTPTIIPGGPTSPPIDPYALNQTPTIIPSGPTSPPITSSPINAAPVAVPTIAETGVPVAAGSAGPASGSLHDIKAASATAGPRSAGQPGNEAQAPVYGQINPPVVGSTSTHETAEEEKNRLKASYESSSTEQGNHETAEEEKKRLEREEREKVLAAGADPTKKKGGDDDLPPYQDYQ